MVRCVGEVKVHRAARRRALGDDVGQRGALVAVFAEQPARRGSSRDAAHLMRDIIATHDERARSAHDVSAATEAEHLPEPVRSLVDHRAKATERRSRSYADWQHRLHTATAENERWKGQQVDRTSSPDYTIELWGRTRPNPSRGRCRLSSVAPLQSYQLAGHRRAPAGEKRVAGVARAKLSHSCP